MTHNGSGIAEGGIFIEHPAGNCSLALLEVEDSIFCSALFVALKPKLISDLPPIGLPSGPTCSNTTVGRGTFFQKRVCFFSDVFAFVCFFLSIH